MKKSKRKKSQKKRSKSIQKLLDAIEIIDVPTKRLIKNYETKLRIKVKLANLECLNENLKYLY